MIELSPNRALFAVPVLTKFCQMQRHYCYFCTNLVPLPFSNSSADCKLFFQEYWCKRLHPKNVCEKVYRQPPLRESLKKGKLRKQDRAVTKHKTTLLQAADSIGKKIQYDCPGFLPNRRQVILQQELD